MDTQRMVPTLLTFFIGSALFAWSIISLLLHSPAASCFKDKPDPRKMHFQPIPRLGGVAFIMTFLVFTAVVFISGFSGSGPLHIETRTFNSLVAFSIASVIILIIGFLDDTIFITVRVRHKLLMEFIIAYTAVFLFDVNFGRLSIPGLYTFPLWFSNAVSFLWIIGLANAYNIIDGIDGLAGSLSLISIATLGILACLGGQLPVMAISLILCGAIIGFLFHNMPPAKTFMGDSGSLFLGTMIALLTLIAGKDLAHGRAIVVMPLIAGIPIIEVMTTMVRRYFKAKDRKLSIFKRIHSMVIPDNCHIHHRFTYRGYSPLQSTLVLSVLALILCCGALCCAFAPKHLLPFIMAYLAIPLVISLDGLGFGGRFKKALHLSPTRYNGFRKSKLIGVVDNSGEISPFFEKGNRHGLEYVFLSENDLSAFQGHLHGAVLHDPFASINIISRAESISTLLSRPVCIVDKTAGTLFHIRDVAKNGSLSIQEQTVSVRDFFRHIAHMASLEKIRHLDPLPSLRTIPAPARPVIQSCPEPEREKVC